MPAGVLLQHDTQLAHRLAVAAWVRIVLDRRRQRRTIMGVGIPGRIDTVAQRSGVEKVVQLGLQRAADRGHAEFGEWHQVAVVFADPIDQPIAAGVGDQHVLTGAAERAILIGWRGFRNVILAAGRVQVVVGVQQIVAPAAIHMIPSGAAHDPIVAIIAKNQIVAVVVDRPVSHRLVAVLLADAGRMEHAFRLVEVQEELHAGVVPVQRAVGVERDLLQGIVLVVERELAGPASDPWMLGVGVDRVEAQ